MFLCKLQELMQILSLEGSLILSQMQKYPKGQSFGTKWVRSEVTLQRKKRMIMSLKKKFMFKMYSVHTPPFFVQYTYLKL